MQKQTLRATLSLALILTAAALAAGCGGSGDTKQANATDNAFVAQMIPHHQMAVTMALQAQRQGSHPETTGLAQAIIGAQNAEITQMRAIAQDIGVEPKAMPMGGTDQRMAGDARALGLSMGQMGMSMDMGSLNRAKPFDRAFIDMMIPHHQGAIRMARAELADGANAKLKAIAKGIVAAQVKEIGEMNTWRAGWYGGASPAGGVPAG